jgi:tRNA nucleotidyltransferase (CCA-adding enzyme)
MKIYLVGGAVRDELLGKKAIDRDYVVVGANEGALKAKGFRAVGKGFPVFLHPITHEEYALARKEIKTGRKHTDFRFIFGPEVTLEEDLMRRDFTCNALAKDLKSGKIFDYHHGIDDIRNKILRHVNTEHFPEDPLRILRLCRFSAQLNFDVAPETLALCRQMVKDRMLGDLPLERVNGEFLKALAYPTVWRFLECATYLGILSRFMPELKRPCTDPQVLDLLKKDDKMLTPLVRFAFLTHTLSCAQIQNLTRRMKLPHIFCTFPLLFAELHGVFPTIFQLSAEEFCRLCARFGRGKTSLLAPYLTACRLMYDLPKNNPNEILLKNVSTFLSGVSARSMPDFDTLPKNAAFKKRVHQFRVESLEKYLQRRLAK